MRSRSFLFRRRRKMMSGFTLIELLVVIFIISIVTGVALFSFGHNEDRKIKAFANDLAQMLSFAQDRALLERKVLGFKRDGSEFYFVSLEQNAKHHKLFWDIIQDQTLNRHLIPHNIEMNIHVADAKDEMKELSSNSSDKDIDRDNGDDEEDTEQNNPQLLIYSNRDFTPFTIFIGKKGEKPQYAIIGQTDGNLVKKTFG